MPLHVLLHRWRQRTLFRLRRPDIVTRGKGYFAFRSGFDRKRQPSSVFTVSRSAPRSRENLLGVDDIEVDDDDVETDAERGAAADGSFGRLPEDADGLQFPEGDPNPWFAPLYHALRMVRHLLGRRDPKHLYTLPN